MGFGGGGAGGGTSSLFKQSYGFPKFRKDEDFSAGLWTPDAESTVTFPTTDVYLGDGAARALHTAVAGGSADITSPNNLGVNVTNRALYLAVKISTADFAQLTSVSILLSNDNGFADYWQFTITKAQLEKMIVPDQWGVISFNPASVGGGMMTVGLGLPTWTTFNKIRLRIIRSGGTNLVVNWGGFFSIPRSTVGAISITFDDGFQGIHDIGLEVLKKYGLTASVMYSSGFTPGVTAGAMTKAQLQNLIYNGWGVCSHSSDSISGKTEAAALAQLKNDRNKVESYGGNRPDIFAYTGGNVDANGKAAAVQVFSMCRGAGGDMVNEIPPADKFIIQNWSMDSTQSIPLLQTAIQAVKTHGGWMVLAFHNVVASGATGQDINKADLDSICSTIATELANATVSLVNIGDMPDFIKKQLKF